MCNRVAIIKEGKIINVQDIKSLQKDNYKKIRITSNDLEEKRFQFEGVSNLQKMDGTLSFFYKGDINLLTRLLGAADISDLTIEDLTLEEIFIHYYE